MSANNELVIRRKQNSLYEIRNIWAEDGTIEELTIEVVADDIDGLDKAVDKANDYLLENEVEYGLRIINSPSKD